MDSCRKITIHFIFELQEDIKKHTKQTLNKFRNFNNKKEMSYTDRHIVKAYSELFEGLSQKNKLELIESLSKSLKSENDQKEKDFYSSFGAFSKEKSAEEIVEELRSEYTLKD